MSVSPQHLLVTVGGPEDGGDFGPHTPGTHTAGIQEGLDAAHRDGRDLHIAGGRGGLHAGQGLDTNVYQVDETIRVPWSQDMTVTGGNYVLSYRGSSGSALVFDSQMNCRYHFGLVVSNAPDPAAIIRPSTPGPDDFVVITASVFDFACIVSGHPEGTSLLVDSSHGPIINNRIFAEETNSQGTGIDIRDGAGEGHWISNNTIEVMYGNQYHGTEGCTGLRLGEPGSRRIVDNRLTLSFHAPRGAHFDEETRRYVTREDVRPERAVGAEIHAQRNHLTLSFFGPRPAGQDIWFEADACDNTVLAMNLPNGITQRSHTPSNRVVCNRSVGFGIETPAVPASGAPCVNTSGSTVQVLFIEPGQVSQWWLADAGTSAPRRPGNLSLIDNLRDGAPDEGGEREALVQSVPGPLHAGQTLVLDPGDSLGLTYATAPTWRWKALR